MDIKALKVAFERARREIDGEPPGKGMARSCNWMAIKERVFENAC
jgi:hypothetical protein